MLWGLPVTRPSAAAARPTQPALCATLRQQDSSPCPPALRPLDRHSFDSTHAHTLTPFPPPPFPPSSLPQSKPSKCVKKTGDALTDIEKRVSAEMSTIEGANEALKSTLKGLTFSAAKEVDVDGGKKAVVIFVPPTLLAEYRKIQKALIEELEKKLSGTHVVFIANRTMLSATTWARSGKYTGVRPRSRSLKAVQDSILDDLVFPAEIAGKRTRVKVDGSRLLKVLLTPKDQSAVEGKTDTFKSLYKHLTQKDISFERA
jgi:small subunit ribosomal protein S7e